MILDHRTDQNAEPHGDQRTIALAMFAGSAAIVSGIVLIVLYGLYPERTGNLVAALLLSGVALFSGILIGFLFGIPRSLQSNDLTPPIQTNVSNEPRVRYGANTNLEQISDWLTKILVGVGLTQLVTLPASLDKIGDYFGPALGSHNNSARVAVTIVVFFSLCGFLFGYLWSRLFLGREFARADLSAITQHVTERISQAYEEQADIDARVLTLVTHYLSSRDWNKVPVNDLRDAIGKASPPFRAQVLTQAGDARSKARSNEQTKPIVERTITIFEALISTAGENDRHEYHGQLGYALKDAVTPNYERAITELTRAINLRGPTFEIGWGLYEFNRAICRIKLDPDFSAKRASSPEAARLILADIRVAVEEFPDLLNDPEMIRWLEINKVKDVRATVP